jgi:hypothetical protein
MKRRSESGAKVVRIGRQVESADRRLSGRDLIPARRLRGMLRSRLTPTQVALLVTAVALLAFGVLMLGRNVVKQSRLRATQESYAERVSRGEIPPAAPGQDED